MHSSRPAILAIVGVVTVIDFFNDAALQYRAQEDQPLEPGYTPDSIELGLNTGPWAVGIGLAVFVIVGILALVR